MLFDEYLRRIIQLKIAGGGVPQPPSPASFLQALRQRSMQRLRVEPDPEYLEFLSQMNGLDFDGMQVYATETGLLAGYSDRYILGFVESNVALRENRPDSGLIVYAEEGDDTFAFDVTSDTYLLIDTVSKRNLETFPSFRDMLARAFQKRLRL